MNQLLISAIQSRSVLSTFYDGGIRLVEPYCYGKGRTGKELLRCWQIEGFSRSGQATGWKLFDVDKMSSVTNTGSIFLNNQTGYNPSGDSAMTEIYSKI